MGGAIANRNVRANPREAGIYKIVKKWGKKYGFDATVSFNEALYDLDLSPQLNILGYNETKSTDERAENDAQKGGLK